MRVIGLEVPNMLSVKVAPFLIQRDEMVSKVSQFPSFILRTVLTGVPAGLKHREKKYSQGLGHPWLSSQH